MINSNFFACLRDKQGRVVPGSIRRGHNVLTNFGREWLSKLMVWQTIAATDVPFTNYRIQWIGVGTDSYSELRSVERLKQATDITPGTYLAVIDNPPIFPAVNWIRFSRTFGTSEISHSGAVTIKEAGLYADEDTGSGPALNTGVGTNQLVAYKIFDAKKIPENP